MTDWIIREDGLILTFNSDSGEFDVDTPDGDLYFESLTYTQARELRDALEHYMGVLSGRSLFRSGTERV